MCARRRLRAAFSVGPAPVEPVLDSPSTRKKRAVSVLCGAAVTDCGRGRKDSVLPVSQPQSFECLLFVETRANRASFISTVCITV